MGFLFICDLRPAWHLQPAELCLEMQATAGQRANQSKTEKEKTNLQWEQESSIMEYKNKFT